MSKRIGAAAAVLAGAALALAPAGGGVQAAPSTSTADLKTASYTPGNRGDALNEQLRAGVERALAAAPSNKRGVAATTVYYSVKNAPTYAAKIRDGAKVWNGSVSNVQLSESNSKATLKYYEGDDAGGSYASSDGHGNGYVLLAHWQMAEYSKLRIITHETGHVLGLPDHYSGPCSELMSGGGPGKSCTNAYPNATEKSTVEALWANGLVDWSGKSGVNAAPSIALPKAS